MLIIYLRKLLSIRDFFLFTFYNDLAIIKKRIELAYHKNITNALDLSQIMSRSIRRKKILIIIYYLNKKIN